MIRGKGWLKPVVILLAVCALALGVQFGSPTSLAAFQATVTNSTNTASSGYVNCESAITADNAIVALVLNDAGKGNGLPRNIGAGKTTATRNSYQGDGFTFNATGKPTGRCPRDSGFLTVSNAVTDVTPSWVDFDGLNAGWTTANITQEIRFRTTTTTGGTLWSISAEDIVQTAAYLKADQGDNQLFMRNDGRLSYTRFTNGQKYVFTSPAAYNDGNWHHVAVTVSNSGGGTIMYVDGRAVATSSVGASSANRNANAHTNIHLGFDNLSGWDGAPTTWGFNGSLSHYAFYGSVLTPLQIQYRVQTGQR